jgi:hypothetical protein
MESSRDSSVWRNLAVTFGGGLALGAVGMKLTQTALRPVDAPFRTEPDPLTDRLSNMERRLELVEHVPAPARPAPAQPVAIPMDQKVLEAVIGAVDARLHEHAGQVDRRLADLEARMAVMQNVQQQDRLAAGQLREETVAVRTAVLQDMRQIRESVSRATAGQAASQTELQILRQQQERIVDVAEQRFADLRQEYRHEIATLRSEMEQSIEARFVTAAAASAAAKMEEQLVPLRAEIQQKEQELAELRQRLADSERSVLDVVLAIGDVCRQAADRITASRETRAATPPAPPSAPPKAPESQLAAAPPSAEPVVVSPSASTRPLETPPVPEAAAEPALTATGPDFLRESTHRASWRIPLVSSVLISSGYFLLMHYLSAPLQ